MKTLKLVAVFMVPLLVVGIFGNLHLLYVTYKVKQLQRRNGILVGIIAFFDLISEMHSVKNAIEIFSDKSRMQRRECFYTIFLNIFSFNMSCMVMLFLAIDRLIAIASPIFYRTISTKRFIFSTFVICFIYSVSLVIINFFLADNEPIALCNQPLAFEPVLMVIWNWFHVAIAIIVIILNAICFFIIQRAEKPGLSIQEAVHYKRQLHVTNSMLVIMLFYGTTTLAAAFVLCIIKLLPLTKHTVADISAFLGLLIFLNYGSNYYALFWRSRDYRAIFLDTLRVRRNNSVSTIRVLPSQRNNVKRTISSSRAHPSALTESKKSHRESVPRKWY